LVQLDMAVVFLHPGLDGATSLYNILCTTFVGMVYMLGNFRPKLSFTGWSKLENFLASIPSVLVICLDNTQLMVETVLNEGCEHSCCVAVWQCCDLLLRQAYNSLGFFLCCMHYFRGGVECVKFSHETLIADGFGPMCLLKWTALSTCLLSGISISHSDEGLCGLFFWIHGDTRICPIHNTQPTKCNFL
jgi:hypothetical protein